MPNTELENLIQQLDSELTELEKHPVTNTKIPSNFSLLTGDITSQLGIDTLFNGKLDDVLGKLFDNLVSGNFDKVSDSADWLNELLDKVGIGKLDFGFGTTPNSNSFQKKAFQGQISQKVINSINYSMQKPKFLKAKSNVKKVIIMLKDLHKESKTIKDSKMKKKFDDAIYAIKKTLIIANRIYKQRRMFNDRMRAGLNSIINEESGVSILSQIYSFHKRLASKYSYGLNIDGKLVSNFTPKQFDENYKWVSPQQFDKQRGGICWDFTTYTADYFSKVFSDIEYDTYYIQCIHDKDKYETHTIFVFKYDKKFYYLEENFKNIIGMYEADTAEDLIRFAGTSLLNHTLKNGTGRVSVFKYDALNSKFKDTDCVQYMDVIVNTGTGLNMSVLKKYNVKEYKAGD